MTTSIAANRTHTTALVIVPPESYWPPIQELRERFDPKVRRWMPHITLVYPFLPREAWDMELPALAAACRAIAPFSLTLGTVGVFTQRRGAAVIWLAPEPKAPLVALHAALFAALSSTPERLASRLTPHLTIGRAANSREREAIERATREAWTPITFPVNEVALLWRNAPPDDVFRVGQRLPLGDRQLHPSSTRCARSMIYVLGRGAGRHDRRLHHRLTSARSALGSSGRSIQ